MKEIQWIERLFFRAEKSENKKKNKKTERNYARKYNQLMPEQSGII